MRTFTQKTVQLFAVICMVVLTAFSAKAEEIKITDSNFANSYPTDATLEIGNISFCINAIANYGNGIQMKKTVGYIYNTTNLVGISSIAFTEKSGKSYNVTVYEGTEENPRTNAVTPVDGVYTFSSGMGYFSIVNGDGASYLDAITITYFESADPTAVAPTEAVAFSAKYNETDTQVVPLSGANLTSDVTVTLAGDHFATETTTLTAEAVMAGADIEVAFTAPEVAGVYEGSISISSEEFETIEVALTATAIDPSAAVEVAWTITQDNFASGGYAANDGEKTIEGVTLQIKDSYKNNGGIQMKVSTGCFYNTNSLSEISSITVDTKTNSVNVYEGTSENPTSLVTGVDGVYTLSAGMSHFKIATTSKYAVLNSVTVNYTSFGSDIPTTPDPEPVDTMTIAGIYNAEDGIKAVIATATVDFVYSSGAYISDEEGTSILAYQLKNVEVGDVLTNISFTAASYNDVKQIKDITYVSAEAGESTLEATEVTLAELMGDNGISLYGGQLVIVKEVTLASTAFDNNNIDISQDGTTSILRNGFYITVENDLPTKANVTGYVTAYNGAAQVNPRAESDIKDATVSGVAQAENATTAVAGVAGGIVVRAADAAMATIYTVAGAQVANVELTAGDNTVELEQGIYLVVVEGAVAKAVVR